MVSDKQLPPGISLFIPLYNEEEILEENVGRLLDYLPTLASRYEIILGSNGSTDSTPEIGQRLSADHSEVCFFHLPVRGPGQAFREAVGRASYGSFVCVDADLTTDIDFIRESTENLRDVDAVVGSKQNGAQNRALVRILASRFFIFCTNLLLHMPFLDYSIGAKAYRTAAIRPLLACVDRHTFYTQALLYRMQRQGNRIVEVPVVCIDRRGSKFNLFHEGFYRFYKLFELWLKR
jgi:glycosyltransferase involved in cell wall biosynthesis